MSDIPDSHPIRSFVIETGNLKDGFQKACVHIATLEQELLETRHTVTQQVELRAALEARLSKREEALSGCMRHRDALIEALAENRSDGPHTIGHVGEEA